MTERSQGEVVFESLSLYGFGPYRGLMSAAFPEGLGVLALPNEQGKSTLVSGLIAMVFGMAHTSVPNAFGSARFRNWSHPRRFEGELRLRVGKIRYRLRRNFDNHRISLAALEHGEWSERVVGEHNPNARRPNPEYEAWLGETFGHASRDLFQATFCVVQPLPLPEQLDAEIQALLTGGGGADRVAALDALATAAKRLTRYTGVLGVTARDGRRDGEIEALAAEIAALEAELATGSRQLDALQIATEELVRYGRELAQLNRRRAEIEGALTNAEDWVEAAKRANERSGEVVQLAEALREIRRLEDGLRDSTKRIEAYLEFHGQDAEIGEGLETLQALERALGELERLRDEARTISALCEQKAAEKAHAIDWDLDGRPATAWVRSFKDAFLQARVEWSSFQALRRRVDDLRRERIERYGVFEEAAPALLEEVAGQKERRRELARALEAAETTASELEEQARNTAAERRSLNHRFAHVSDRIDDLAVIEELADLREERKRIVGELATAAAPLRLFAWVRVVAGAVAGALAAMAALGSIVPAWAFAFSMALTALALFGAGIPPFSRSARVGKELRRALLAIEKQERRLADGALSWADLDRLDAVRSDLVAYREALDVLERQAERDALRLQDAKARTRACRLRLDDFDARMRDLIGGGGELDQAYRAWRELVEEERRLIEMAMERVAAWNVPGLRLDAKPGTVAGDAGRDGPEGWEGLDPFARVEACDPAELREPWTTLAQSLRTIAGREPGLIEAPGPERLPQAVAVLDMLNEAFWRAIEERASTHDRLREEIFELEIRAESIERGEMERWRRAATERLETLERTFPGDWRPIVALLDPSGPGGAIRVEKAVPPPFSVILRASGGDVAEARSRFRAWAELAGEAERLKSALRSTLSTWGCETIAELEQRLTTTEAGLLHAVGRLEALAKVDPALPERPGGAMEGVVRRVERLRSDMVEIKERIESLEEASLHVRRRQAELQGVRPVNVAEAKERLGALGEERERLRIEVEALALAHAELSRAAEAYYGDHVGRLARAASARFSSLCGRPGRRVTLSDELEVGVVEPDGAPVAVAQLSMGAQDLLYISLRLAIADLMSGARALPFILDDPFLNFDAARLARMRESLLRLASERQVLLLTHREELRSWGDAIDIRVEVEGVPHLVRSDRAQKQTGENPVEVMPSQQPRIESCRAIGNDRPEA